MFNNVLLSDVVALDRVMTAQGAGTSVLNSDGVELKDGAEGVMFVVSFGALTVAPTVHAEQSADNSSYADLASSEIANIDNADDNKLVIVDVKRSGADADEYVRLVIDRSGGNTVVDSVVAYVYGKKNNLPLTQGADVAQTKKLYAPIEGTK